MSVLFWVEWIGWVEEKTDQGSSYEVEIALAFDPFEVDGMEDEDPEAAAEAIVEEWREWKREWGGDETNFSTYSDSNLICSATWKIRVWIQIQPLLLPLPLWSDNQLQLHPRLQFHCILQPHLLDLPLYSLSASWLKSSINPHWTTSSRETSSPLWQGSS